MCKFCETISLSASNLFLTELIFRYPTITRPMFLNLNNFNEDFASIAPSAEVSGVDASVPEIFDPLFKSSEIWLSSSKLLIASCRASALPSLDNSQ